MNGIMLVDKPEGWTSHDVVAKVRSILKKESGQKVRVGHTGTLDPIATGLLVLVVGSYTKKASKFSKLDKTYEAEVTLGAISTTGDKEGEISAYSTQPTADSKKPSEKRLREILRTFEGQIDQTPHPYSAVKIDGQRAYKIARRGEIPKIEPRKVTIYSISDVRYKYPKLCFTAKVSSGTYIRSLAEDIGTKLGTGAYLSALRRTEVGKYSVNDAKNLQEIKKTAIII